MTFWMRAGRKTQTLKLIIQKMIDNEFSPASSKQPGTRKRLKRLGLHNGKVDVPNSPRRDLLQKVEKAPFTQ